MVTDTLGVAALVLLPNGRDHGLAVVVQRNPSLQTKLDLKIS